MGHLDPTRGINYFLGDAYDAREDYSSQRLQTYHAIGTGHTSPNRRNILDGLR